MTWEEHVHAVKVFNNACNRIVGASQEGEVTAPTEFGLMAIGADIPTQLHFIAKMSPGFKTSPDSARLRVRAAKWFRELADRIEAHELLQPTPPVPAGRTDTDCYLHFLSLIAIMEQRDGRDVHKDLRCENLALYWGSAQAGSWMSYPPVGLLQHWPELSLDRVGRGKREVTRIFRGRILSPAMNGGYLKVSISLEGKYRSVAVHYLILETFRGSRPLSHVARHLDDDESNNRLSNLMWGTQLENMQDAKRNGRIHCNLQLAHTKIADAEIPAILRRLELGESSRSVARSYHVTHKVILNIRAGKRSIFRRSRQTQ